MRIPLRQFLPLWAVLFFSLFKSQSLWSMDQTQVSFLKSINYQELIQSGKKSYDLKCAGCHGEKGDGKGPSSVFLNPKPRDFTQGIYKFRSTPLESVPTDHDLMKTIAQGVHGTSMPEFSLVPEVERFAMVAYIKTFYPGWAQKEKASRPVVIGAPFPKDDFSQHAPFIARATRGQKIFNDACVVCHGLGGKGDGEGSVGLEDAWGNPIVPGNLTKPYIKSGKSVHDIYRTLLTGLDGTPMPPFKDAYTDDELWDVAAYVLYLRGLHHGVYDQNNPPIPPLK